MASKPLQNFATSTPVPGSTCSSMKRFKALSTSSPWMVVRLVMVFSCGFMDSLEEAQHVAQAAAGARRLRAELLERQLVAVHPERAVAEPGRAQRVPGIAADEQHVLRRQAGGLRAEAIGLGMGLVFADGVDRQHVIEQVLEARAADRDAQHAGIAV